MTREGLVMEVNETYSIFMTHEGEFVKGVPTTIADVGEYAHFTPYKEKFNPKQAILAGPFIAIAASSLILFGSLFSDLPEAYAYVDLENGERIELGIDEDGNVIHIEGTQIEDDWENKPLSVVLVEIAETSPVAAFSHGNMRDGEIRSHVTKAIELAEEVEPVVDETETVSEPTTPVEVTDDSEDTEAADESEATEEQGETPSVVAPGKAGTTPGQSGTTPGKSDQTPAEGAEPPGKAGTAPGKSGDTPGKNGTAPGKSDDAPGKSKDAPGKSDKAPGQSKDKSGNGNKSKSNNSDKKQEGGGKDTNSSPQMKKFNTDPTHNKSNNGNN